MNILMNIKQVQGGICAPIGFKASGVAARLIGKKIHKKDVAILYSDVPAVAAGVFTTNIVRAAPVLVSEKMINDGILQAIIVNSRNANACTGEQGMKDAQEMCLLTAQCLGINPHHVAVASTGVIGVPLDMERVRLGIRDASESIRKDGNFDAAEAIMTTDTFMKEIAIQIELDGILITIGGISKGSGMVHPNMATILGFITTDASISSEALKEALRQSNQNSFNMISVDGDTSTNDMVLAMANGKSGNRQIELYSPEYEDFADALEMVCTFLAKEIARDGEGATKLLEVHVIGAETVEDARIAARTVSKSLLVKTAIFGADANWGRILCALGYSGAKFKPEQVNLFIGAVQVMKHGTPLKFDEEAAINVLTQKEVIITADLQSGNAKATAWGCDLSYDYVKINGAYRT